MEVFLSQKKVEVFVEEAAMVAMVAHVALVAVEKSFDVKELLLINKYEQNK